MLHFAPHHFPQMRILSDEQMRSLHLATLEILERTGVEVKEARARELLRSAGARIDGERARIPANLVEQAVRTAPERVVVSSRGGKRVMPLEEGKVFFGTGSDTPNTMDPRTRQRRASRFQDLVDIARLSDALPNIDFIMSMGIVSDAPPRSNYVHGFAAMLEGSCKPIVFTANDLQDMRYIHKMAAAAAGGEESLRANPFLVLYDEPISPLIHSPNGLAKLLYCADHGIPAAYISGMLSGGTAPVTLAGDCALANAECLSGLVIHQLAAPGAPFVYGANVALFDMSTSVCAYGGPEFSLTNAAFADLARFYHLPVWGLAGAADSKVLDAQAGAEAMFSITAAIAARGNLVHDVGYLENGLTSSMEMIAFCDEIISMLSIFFRGIPMDADRLAIDLIDEVGPGGHFLDSDHTLRYFRTEHFLPRLFDRRNFENWKSAGAPDLPSRANRRVLEILDSHRPAPLSDQAKAVIQEVLSQSSTEQQD
jgi:trimethylamine--corrinoid protein Co-methyltransferase